MKNKLLFVLPVVACLFISSCGETPTPTANTYLITFKDEEGTTLESKRWEEGTIPSYTYNKQDTAEWDYTVEGWSLTQGGAVITIPAATADATYFAIVSKEKRSYSISFYKENDELIKSETLEYGAQPQCDYVGPEDTDEWDYTFGGWSTSKGGTAIATIPTVSGQANYYAAVSKTKKQYAIKFIDEAGTELTTINFDYGTTPSYTYNKQDTAEWDYTVEGWSLTAGGNVLSTLPSVTGNATYFAIVSKTKQRYSITFESNGGTAVTTITDEYGASINEPTKPTKENHKFVAWTTDTQGQQKVTWPITLTSNIKLYANWNEIIDIKAYLKSLIDAVGYDPYSYIPETMQPDNSDNHVTASQMDYDFTNFTSVSAIKYGGFGEQWHMVVENIKESERFYSILTLGEAAINASVLLFNNYLDNNPGDTATHTLNETAYTAKIDFHNGLLQYTIQYKTGWDIPLFGEVLPQIDMTYNVTTLEKAVRIQLSENNAMRYVVTDNSYAFGIEYGVTAVSRKAYFQIDRLEDESVEGHIYEYVQFKDKELIPACADFYIGKTYTSVVGNKASGMPGFSGYINELYETANGKLLGYEVREEFTKWGVTAKYHTLWFNLNNISGITNVKAIKNENSTYGLGGNNNHDIYLNNSASIFEPTYNTKLLVKTSRKYDVELRKQYFYGYVDDKLTEYEASIPMMFIQADHDDYTNFTDFPNDILSKSGINASVNLASKYLTKIQEDYASLVDVFIGNKEKVTSSAIDTYIGNAIVIE